MKFLHTDRKNKGRNDYIYLKKVVYMNQLTEDEVKERFGKAYDAGLEIIKGQIDDNTQKAEALLTEKKRLFDAARVDLLNGKDKDTFKTDMYGIAMSPEVAEHNQKLIDEAWE